ncbi:hypothetical protein Bca4012_061649 [Brassica carinata]
MAHEFSVYPWISFVAYNNVNPFTSPGFVNHFKPYIYGAGGKFAAHIMIMANPQLLLSEQKADWSKEHVVLASELHNSATCCRAFLFINNKAKDYTRLTTNKWNK